MDVFRFVHADGVDVVHNILHIYVLNRSDGDVFHAVLLAIRLYNRWCLKLYAIALGSYG